MSLITITRWGCDVAFRGRPSTAHEYDKNSECVYCGTYKSAVDAMSLVCTPAREAIADKLVIDDEAKALKEREQESVFERTKEAFRDTFGKDSKEEIKHKKR